MRGRIVTMVSKLTTLQPESLSTYYILKSPTCNPSHDRRLPLDNFHLLSHRIFFSQLLSASSFSFRPNMKPLMLANLTLLFLCFGAIHQIPWPFTLLFPFLFFLFILLNYWLIPGGFAWRNHQYQTTPNLRGPSGWPILGNLPDQMAALAHRRLASMAASYGATRLMAFSLGATRAIISSHPETAKEILCGSSFTDRPIKQSARLLMFERAIGFAPSGSYWRHLRRIAANYMFAPRRISRLEPLRQRVANQMLAGVWKEMEEGGVVELRGIFQRGSLSNILESVFGSTCLINLEREELGGMVREGYELIAKYNWEDYLPLRFLDFYGVKRRCHRLAGKVHNVVGQMVKERKSSAGDDLHFGDGNDFLSALLSLPMEDQLSDSDMVAVLWVRTLLSLSQLISD